MARALGCSSFSSLSDVGAGPRASKRGSRRRRGRDSNAPLSRTLRLAATRLAKCEATLAKCEAVLAKCEATLAKCEAALGKCEATLRSE